MIVKKALADISVSAFIHFQENWRIHSTLFIVGFANGKNRRYN